MRVKCPSCGDVFDLIGNHWVQSSDCDHPKLTKEQKEIATGLLMGDGCMDLSGKNPHLSSKMTNKEYLQFVDEKFDILGTGVSLVMTAKESAKEARSSGFSPDAKAENYSAKYIWHSRRHPEFQELAEWYSTGRKVWPENIELTPTVLKHWYCGDGNWNNCGTNNHIQISMVNEAGNTDKVTKLFENMGLPSPSNYNISERESEILRCSAQFNVDKSKELWEYMGEPLPGFEYKWPEEYRKT